MNSTVKSIFRGLGRFVAFILSIVLVVLLLSTVLYTSVISMFSPKSIANMVRDIDYAAILKESGADIRNDEIQEQIDTYIQPLLQSDFTEDLAEIYIESLDTVIDGGKAEITKDTLADLVDKHMDDIVSIVKKSAPADFDLHDAEIREKIREIIDERGDDLLEPLNSTEGITDLLEEAKEIPMLLTFISRQAIYILWGICLAFAVLIFFCLYGGARGLRCVGIDALIACLPLTALLVFIGDGSNLLSLMDAPDEAGSLLTPILASFANKLLISTILLAVAGVLLIAGFIAWRVFKKKRAATPMPTFEVEPAQTAGIMPEQPVYTPVAPMSDTPAEDVVAPTAVTTPAMPDTPEAPVSTEETSATETVE